MIFLFYMKKIFLLTACVLLLGACSKKEKAKDQAFHKTMEIKLQDESLQSEYSARFTGRQIVEIRPQVSGTIKKICITEGSDVKKGQTLFIIDQVPYEAALQVAIANVRSAEAKVQTAKLNLESNMGLEENAIISDFQVKTSRNALLEAEAALAQAKAQETNARNNLSYTVVRSPVDGVAGMIPYHVGALVGSSIADPLVTVSDDSEIYAYFSITESHSIDLLERYNSMKDFIAQAPEIRLRMNNGKEYAHAGRIDAVSGIVDESTGAVTLRATFRNEGHLLHNGGNGTVIIPTELKNCIVIPQAATYELQNRTFVYRVINDTARSTAVEVFRLNNGTEYVVENGLQPGDTIVAEGAGLLKDGTFIQKK